MANYMVRHKSRKWNSENCTKSVYLHKIVTANAGNDYHRSLHILVHIAICFARHTTTFWALFSPRKIKEFDNLVALFGNSVWNASFTRQYEPVALWVFNTKIHFFVNMLPRRRLMSVFAMQLSMYQTFSMLPVWSIFFRLINHRLNRSLKNWIFFDYVWLIRQWSKNQFFFLKLLSLFEFNVYESYVNYAKISVYFCVK